MEFIDHDGKKVVLHAMDQYPPKILSCQSMEVVLRHGDIEWVVECYISDKIQLKQPRQYPDDIKEFLRKHQFFFC